MNERKVVRDYKLDNIKGFLIFFVVFSHMLITYKYVEISKYSIIVKFIYVFHMPLFFMISGKLSKKIDIKRIVNYFVLFLFMQGTFLLYDYFIYGSFSFFNILYSSWFLLLLVLYRIIFSNQKINKLFDKKYSVFLTIIIVLLVGFLPINIIVSRFFYFFLFFLIGYKKNIIFSKKQALFFLPVFIILIIMISSISRLDFLMGDRYIVNFEIVLRFIIIFIDVFLYYLFKTIIVDREIPFVTKIGSSSLFIYVLHRIPTLLLSDNLYIYKGYIFISIVISIIMCVVIAFLSRYIKIIFQSKIFYVSVIMLLCGLLFSSVIYKNELSLKTQNELDNCISIGFVGDLILLEDQLKNSNDNFDYLFDNMKSYFEKTDYMVGVLEGPVDDTSELSYGNFDDNKELRLNYPTSFIESIKNANIDLVSIANNHMFDRGEQSYNNTLSNLRKNNLDYVGDNNNYQIIDIKGLKVGFLAYSYGSNYDEDMFKEKINYLVEPSSLEFKKVKKEITKDFNYLKQKKVDLIVVLPHYGTQFSNRVDSYQEYYNRLFVNLGADIILGDHAHTIQPIYYYGDSIIINCPGNYINSYVEYNGDISMFVKIYIDKNKKIKGSSITPIIAEKNENGLYYPVTMKMGSTKTERAKSLVSDVIFKNDIKKTSDTYYYLKDKHFKYGNSYYFELTESDKKSLMYQKIEEHNRICFIGDSITEGTKNGFHPWYEKLISYFDDKQVVNISKGSYTTSDILENFSDDIKNSNCDLTVINIGTNDIRYYSRDVSEYIDNMKKIISYIDGEVIILAPWQTTERDYNISKRDHNKRKLYSVYNEKLQLLDNIYYIDPNEYIKEAINHNSENDYLIDGVHPNSKEGVSLYSFSVLRSN